MSNLRTVLKNENTLGVVSLSLHLSLNFSIAFGTCAIASPYDIQYQKTCIFFSIIWLETGNFLSFTLERSGWLLCLRPCPLRDSHCLWPVLGLNREYFSISTHLFKNPPACLRLSWPQYPTYVSSAWIRARYHRCHSNLMRVMPLDSYVGPHKISVTSHRSRLFKAARLHGFILKSRFIKKWYTVSFVKDFVTETGESTGENVLSSCTH